MYTLVYIYCISKKCKFNKKFFQTFNLSPLSYLLLNLNSVIHLKLLLTVTHQNTFNI